MKFKIKDKYLLGFVSAAIVATILNFVDYLSVRLHINEWHIWQIAGSLFFGKEELTGIPALIIGALTHTTLIGFAGVIICYILHYTGRTWYIVKGITVFLLFWIMLFGGILSLKITSITQPVGAQTNIAHMIGHITAGILTSLLIVKAIDKSAWDN